jgi:hypothetical protein
MNMDEPSTIQLVTEVLRLEAFTNDAVMSRCAAVAAGDRTEVARVEHCLHLGEVSYLFFQNFIFEINFLSPQWTSKLITLSLKPKRYPVVSPC